MNKAMKSKNAIKHKITTLSYEQTNKKSNGNFKTKKFILKQINTNYLLKDFDHYQLIVILI